MQPREPHSPTPVLSYANPPLRRPSLALANVVAIAGICVWLVAVPAVIGGFVSLAFALSDVDLTSILGALTILLIGLGAAYLAIRLCRSVHRIYSGKSFHDQVSDQYLVKELTASVRHGMT
jgi:hypothetical protein